MRKYCLLVLAALIACLPAAALAEQGELVYNGDFSVHAQGEALPAGWSFDAWTPEDSLARTQNGTVILESAFENDAKIHQTVTVEPNTIYEITCEAWAKDIFGSAGAAITVLDTFASSEGLFHEPEWTKLTLVGETGPDQTELTIALRLGGYGALASGEAGFRAVSMRPLTAAPGGVALQSFAPLKPSGGGEETEFGGAALFAIALCFVGAALGFVYLYRRYVRDGDFPASLTQPNKSPVWALLLAAFFVRVLLSLVFRGHSTDISCFMAWSDAMVAYGPGGFYASGMFADYPPGYMYVLWLLGGLRRLLGLGYDSALFILLLKLPAIAADLASAYLVYRLAKGAGAKEHIARFLLGAVALNPVMAFLSGGWGQIDSLMTLCLVAVILLYQKGRPIWAGAAYGFAILLKPQALMLGPILAVAYLFDCRGRKALKRLLCALGAAACAVAVILLLALPFAPEPGLSWLLQKYFSTATSYPYASVEAFNLMALFGGNWKPAGDTLLFLSYGTWGSIFILSSVIAAGALYIRGSQKNPGALLLCGAFLLTALFTLGQYMHERYVFPALLLLLIAAVYYDDRRLMACYAWFSATLLLNALAAFVIVDAQELRGNGYNLLTFFGSLFTVFGFVYLCRTAFDILWRGRTKPTALLGKAPLRPKKSVPSPAHNNTAAPLPPILEAELHGGRPISFTRKDRLYCWILTGVYAIVSLVNLGSFLAPETYYDSELPGESVTLTFANPVTIGDCWVFGGLNEGAFLMVNDAGAEAVLEQEDDTMFRWKVHSPSLGQSSAITLTTYSGSIWINEIAFFDAQGGLITPIAADRPEGMALFDEQETVPEYPSYYNGMYFDELYHARTAYEHLNALKPLENSHPPLGKVIIMLGVALFGMNPFGWRIMGALFGIAIVPLMYAFARRLFGKADYALLTAGLFAFDFMHFTQTRIATIDSFSVFFIIAMYYYMYRYYTMSFYKDGLRATLKPLMLAGLFFGLGAATKWICIYAGGGLAVILLLSLVKRYREYKSALREIRPGPDKASFWGNTIRTLLWCCLFYVFIPVTLYILSYLPYYFALIAGTGGGLKEYLTMVFGYQEFMWSYHSGLVATHPYQSSWWQWPFTLKPMWYCLSGDVPAGLLSTLTASGNPAVWWVSTVLTVVLVIKLLLKRIKIRPGMVIALVGVGANFLPWTLVTRCTFIYHFFATVPFILIAAVYVLQEWERSINEGRFIKWIWLGAAIVLFLLLYPGLSGLPIPMEYAKFLKLVPGGHLMYGA